MRIQNLFRQKTSSRFSPASRAAITRQRGASLPVLTGKDRLQEGERSASLASGLLAGLAFMLGLLLIVHGLVFVADTVAPDSNTRFLQVDRRHIDQILASAESIDALVLGNSHAGSVQMADLGFANGYRFARADGDLFEVSYLLRYLTPRLPQLKVVLIPISYFSLQSENTGSQEVEIRRAHLYASISSWQVLPGDWKSFLVGKSHTYFPVPRLLREDNWEGVFFALLGRPVETKGFIEVEAGDCSSLSPEQMSASLENRVAKYTRLTQAMTANHPDLVEDVYATLVDTVRDLRSQGVRVVLYTPPYWHGYTERYQAQDPAAIQQMRTGMERLQQELGVEYFDYSQDPEFSQNLALFKDSDHLNSCGAELFSRKLAQAVHPLQAAQP